MHFDKHTPEEQRALDSLKQNMESAQQVHLSATKAYGDYLASLRKKYSVDHTVHFLSKSETEALAKEQVVAKANAESLEKHLAALDPTDRMKLTGNPLASKLVARNKPGPKPKANQ